MEEERERTVGNGAITHSFDNVHFLIFYSHFISYTNSSNDVKRYCKVYLSSILLSVIDIVSLSCWILPGELIEQAEECSIELAQVDIVQVKFFLHFFLFWEYSGAIMVFLSMG